TSNISLFCLSMIPSLTSGRRPRRPRVPPTPRACAPPLNGSHAHARMPSAPPGYEGIVPHTGGVLHREYSHGLCRAPIGEERIGAKAWGRWCRFQRYRDSWRHGLWHVSLSSPSPPPRKPCSHSYAIVRPAGRRCGRRITTIGPSPCWTWSSGWTPQIHLVSWEYGILRMTVAPCVALSS